jgi:hypothetical protein
MSLWALIFVALALWWVVLPAAIVALRFRRVRELSDHKGLNRSEFCESRERSGVARSRRCKPHRYAQCPSPEPNHSPHRQRQRLRR